MTKLENYITVSDFATQAGVSVQAVHKALNAARIKDFKRIGSIYLIGRAELTSYKEKRVRVPYDNDTPDAFEMNPGWREREKRLLVELKGALAERARLKDLPGYKEAVKRVNSVEAQLTKWINSTGLERTSFHEGIGFAELRMSKKKSISDDNKFVCQPHIVFRDKEAK